MWAFVKDLSDRYPVVEVTFFRCLFAILPVMPMLPRFRWRILRVRRISGHVWRAVLGTVSMVLGFTAYHLMPLADAVAISFVSPLMLTALSVPMLGETGGHPPLERRHRRFRGCADHRQPGRRHAEPRRRRRAHGRGDIGGCRWSPSAN